MVERQTDETPKQLLMKGLRVLINQFMTDTEAEIRTIWIETIDLPGIAMGDRDYKIKVDGVWR